MLCRYPSFLRKQESRPPAPRLWMPDHVRHDESVLARLQLIVNRANPPYLLGFVPLQIATTTLSIQTWSFFILM